MARTLGTGADNAISKSYWPPPLRFERPHDTRIMPTFDLKLLQAVNDWQKGGAHVKQSRGRRLKQLAAALDPQFRTVNQPCYRRIDLDSPGLQRLGEMLRLPETISAWTLSADVAQGHNKGVPPYGAKLGIIIRIEPAPPPAAVIVSLDALYNDAAFVADEAAYRHQIKQFDRGIGRYGNAQREVVIECPEVRLDQVWAWGGHSSSKEELLAGMRAGTYGPEYGTSEAIEAVQRGVEGQPHRLGPQWLIGPDAVQRTRERLAFHAKSRVTNRPAKP